MTNERLKISPPWITYVNKVRALFQQDPEIEVQYNNDGPTLTLSSPNPDKAAALAQAFPDEQFFGNVCLEINIDAPNGISNIIFKTPDQLLKHLFFGNAAFSFIHEVKDIWNNKMYYVVFKNCVVQFFNDNLNDIYGNISTLYQDIAREIFADAEWEGVFYCTDVETHVAGMKRDWP